MKRDRDNMDFRDIAKSYKHREKGCVFCKLSKKKIVDENELAYVVRDSYPVTNHHTLIIPRRHVDTYFDLGQAEINAVNQLLKNSKENILEMDDTVTGFNMGINNGTSAGQTVNHCHVHLIPRREGDVESSTGGIRNVIPGKGDYLEY